MRGFIAWLRCSVTLDGTGRAMAKLMMMPTRRGAEEQVTSRCESTLLLNRMSGSDAFDA